MGWSFKNSNASNKTPEKQEKPGLLQRLLPFGNKERKAASTPPIAPAETPENKLWHLSDESFNTVSRLMAESKEKNPGMPLPENPYRTSLSLEDMPGYQAESGAETTENRWAFDPAAQLGPKASEPPQTLQAEAPLSTPPVTAEQLAPPTLESPVTQAELAEIEEASFVDDLGLLPPVGQLPVGYSLNELLEGNVLTFISTPRPIHGDFHIPEEGQAPIVEELPSEDAYTSQSASIVDMLYSQSPINDVEETKKEAAQKANPFPGVGMTGFNYPKPQAKAVDMPKAETMSATQNKSATSDIQTPLITPHSISEPSQEAIDWFSGPPSMNDFGTLTENPDLLPPQETPEANTFADIQSETSPIETHPIIDDMDTAALLSWQPEPSDGSTSELPGVNEWPMASVDTTQVFHEANMPRIAIHPEITGEFAMPKSEASSPETYSAQESTWNVEPDNDFFSNASYETGASQDFFAQYPTTQHLESFQTTAFNFDTADTALENTPSTAQESPFPVNDWLENQSTLENIVAMPSTQTAESAIFVEQTQFTPDTPDFQSLSENSLEVLHDEHEAGIGEDFYSPKFQFSLDNLDTSADVLAPDNQWHLGAQPAFTIPTPEAETPATVNPDPLFSADTDEYLTFFDGDGVLPNYHEEETPPVLGYAFQEPLAIDDLHSAYEASTEALSEADLTEFLPEEFLQNESEPNWPADVASSDEPVFELEQATVPPACYVEEAAEYETALVEDIPTITPVIPTPQVITVDEAALEPPPIETLQGVFLPVGSIRSNISATPELAAPAQNERKTEQRTETPFVEKQRPKMNREREMFAEKMRRTNDPDSLHHKLSELEAKVLLDETRFTKRSIDQLVEQYFSQTETDNYL